MILCERGIRTFETATRNTLDLSAVPVLRERTHLPVFVDPSHAAGERELVPPMARAAKAVGAQGIMVEIHPDPGSRCRTARRPSRSPSSRRSCAAWRRPPRTGSLERARLRGDEDQLTEEDLFQTNELSRPASSRLVHKAQQQAEKGELAAAVKTLQRAVDLDPHPAGPRDAGRAVGEAQPTGAGHHPVAAAVTLDVKGGAAAALAHVFMRLRREPEAHAMATLALQRRPGDRQALEVLEATREDD